MQAMPVAFRVAGMALERQKSAFCDSSEIEDLTAAPALLQCEQEATGRSKGMRRC